MAIRIILCDRFNANLMELEKICKKDPNLTIISSTTRAADLVNAVIRQRPHVVVLSTSANDLELEETISRIMHAAPTPIVLLHTDRYPLGNRGKIVNFGIVDDLRVDVVSNKIQIRDSVLTTRIYILSKLKMNKFSSRIKEALKNGGQTFSRIKPIQFPKHSKSPKSSKIINDDVSKKEITEFEKFTEVYVPLGPLKYSGQGRINKVVIIGTSTGGPRLLAEIVPQFPINLPPVIIVQHMPVGFISSFAQRLDRLSDIKVVEARQNQILLPGYVYIAPGGYHLELSKNYVDNRPRILLTDKDPVNYVKPSVDVTLASACEIYGSGIVSVILTGMGSDGANGCQTVKKLGGKVIALNEADSDIFGMNRAVIQTGSADLILSKQELVLGMIRAIEGRF